MTVEGSAKSAVPSRSFCNSSSSVPSWLDPNTTTFALSPSFSLARRANSSAESWNSEPGSPTWPNLISVWAAAAAMPLAKIAAMQTMNLRMVGLLRIP